MRPDKSSSTCHQDSIPIHPRFCLYQRASLRSIGLQIQQPPKLGSSIFLHYKTLAYHRKNFQGQGCEQRLQVNFELHNVDMVGNVIEKLFSLTPTVASSGILSRARPFERVLN
jgi:hypothetical protein